MFSLVVPSRFVLLDHLLPPVIPCILCRALQNFLYSINIPCFLFGPLRSWDILIYHLLARPSEVDALSLLVSSRILVSSAGLRLTFIVRSTYPPQATHLLQQWRLRTAASGGEYDMLGRQYESPYNESLHQHHGAISILSSNTTTLSIRHDMSTLQDIPPEVFLDNLLPYLPITDLQHIGATNKYFYKLTSDDLFWKRKLREDYNFSDSSTARNTGWKFIYKRLANPKVYVWGYVALVCGALL